MSSQTPEQKEAAETFLDGIRRYLEPWVNSDSPLSGVKEFLAKHPDPDPDPGEQPQPQPLLGLYVLRFCFQGLLFRSPDMGAMFSVSFILTVLGQKMAERGYV